MTPVSYIYITLVYNSGLVLDFKKETSNKLRKSNELHQITHLKQVNYLW